MSEAREALPDLAAMATYGARIAARLRAGDVVALEGGLGAGKTTLARAILAALGHAGEVPSPTFTIIETYAAPPLRLAVVHADFYRLDDPSELAEIGLDDYREGAVLLAEWPDHAGGFAREPGCLAITLYPQGESGEGGRIAIARGGADWVGRMP
ncbi:MAG: tRNA (adenosine(37)-N6)-threonylcarbamoyltransferase complex ATPase subunit type 1 TsaE [Erythrobacter sp.]|nr:tRNA (adenosine(37)-N6)-threonylcarbamoyltransferase complex ATPase subunit type 1 TsaE [Erythrobacter sp.]MBA4082074.1 tRNA (adenosine(37)-N6)-threonylcarbamoyltransferase complex ATPase subunit type 1 TsaE [Erythrobacter sp.]